VASSASIFVSLWALARQNPLAMSARIKNTFFILLVVECCFADANLKEITELSN
jgi:hypothetical protein